MSIYDKLFTIQKSVRGMTKDKDGHGYKYVSGDKIISHVRSMMDDLGVILKPEIPGITNERQDYTVTANKWENGVKVEYQKNKHEILTTLDIRFTWICVETKETDVCEWKSNGQNDWDKGVGSALTYAERYFLLKYFHVPTDEDDIDNPDRKHIPTDEDDKKAPKEELVKANTMTEKQFNSALSRINKGEKDVIKNARAANIFIPPAQLKVLQEAENNCKITTEQFEEYKNEKIKEQKDLMPN